MKQDDIDPKKTDQQTDALQKVDLNSYAGDEDDNQQAIQQADRYMEDLDRARNQGSGDKNEQPAE